MFVDKSDKTRRVFHDKTFAATKMILVAAQASDNTGPKKPRVRAGTDNNFINTITRDVCGRSWNAEEEEAKKTPGFLVCNDTTDVQSVVAAAVLFLFLYSSY